MRVILSEKVEYEQGKWLYRAWLGSKDAPSKRCVFKIKGTESDFELQQKAKELVANCAK